jgi:hypothetical protein
MARWIPIFATCGVLWSPTARADSTTEAPPSDSAVTAADEQRLQWILDTASSDARQGRERAAVVDAVFSAIVLPSGIILVTRSDRGLEAVGVNLIVDGGWGLLGLASTPFPSTMEKLRARHEKLKASGANLATVVKETEGELRELASQPRGTSPWLVVARLVDGVALVGAGTYLLLSNSPPVDRAQTTFGALFVGLGMPPLMGGVRDLLPQPASSAEEWWNIYEMGKVPQAPTAAWPSLSVVPIPHGAAGALRFAF